MIAGTLEIQLLADLARLQQDMDKATGLVGRASDKIEAVVGGAMKALGALGIGLSVGAITTWANNVLDAAGAIHDLATQTGASVESLSRFQEIGRTSGTTADTIAAAMGRLAKNTALSDDESKLAALSLKAMGVEFDTFRKMKPDEQLLTVARALDQYEDGAGKSAIAQALMGKEGAKLLPFLKDLATDTDTAAVLTAKQAAAADELGDKMTALKARVQGAAAGFALDLLPALDKITGLFVPAATVAAAYFAIFVGFPAIATAAVAGFNAVMLAISGMGTTAVAASTSLMTLHTAGLALIALFAGWQIGTWLRENFLEAQLAGVAFVEGTMLGWERLKLVALSAWAVIESGWETALSGMGGFMGSFLQKIAGGLSALGLDDAAAKVLAWATKVTDATKSSGDLAGKLGTLKSQYDTAAASVRAITGDMANDAIAKFNSTEATEKNRKSTGDLAAQIEAARVKLKAEEEARRAATAAAADAAKKHEELLASYVKLADGALQKAQAAELEDQAGRKLTETEQAWVRITADVIAGRVTTTELVRNGTVAKLEEAAALEAAAAARQRDLQWMRETGAENAKFRDSVYSSTVSIQEQIEKQRQANDQIGLSKEALAQLSIQKDLDRAATLERNATIMEEIDADLAAEWRKQAGALRELADLKDKGIHVQAAKDSADAWKKTTADIERGLTDSLFRAFESGKDFFSTLWSGIVNTIKTTVLRVVIDAAVSWVKDAGGSLLSSILGGSGSDGLGGFFSDLKSSMGGWFGSLGNSMAGLIGSLGNTLGGILSGLGNAIGGWVGSLASGAGSFISGATTGTGTGALGSIASGAGTAYNWLTGGAATGAAAAAGGFGATGAYGYVGGALTEVGVAGGAASSLGSMAAAAGPYVAAAIAIYAIAKSLEGGETRSGGQYQYGQTPLGDGRSGFLSGPSGGQIAGDQVQQAIGGTIASINQLLKDAGSAAQLVGFQAALESSNNGRGGVYAGGTLNTGAMFGELGLGGGRSNYNGTLYETTSSTTVDSKTALENFSIDLLQAQIQALQAVNDLPAEISSLVQGIDAESLTAQAATELLGKVAEAVKARTAASAAASGAGIVQTAGDQVLNTQGVTYTQIGDLIAIANATKLATDGVDAQVKESEMGVRTALYDIAGYAGQQRDKLFGEMRGFRDDMKAEAQATRVQIYYTEQIVKQAVDVVSDLLNRATRGGQPQIFVADA